MSPQPRRRSGSRARGPAPRRHQRGRTPAQSPAERAAAFWGDPAALPPARQDVRIAEDPGAVARSLGPPPLAGHEVVAEHYLVAVHERTATLAGALAVAGGLLEPDELPDDRD